MEVYAQRLKRVHATNLKTHPKTAESQTQTSSFFKYSSIIKAFLAGLTSDVLRARVRQVADDHSLTLAQFLEIHRDQITESLKSTGGPLYLVYPKHHMGLDLEQWNSRLLCTILIATGSINVRENDDVMYLCDLSKRYFHPLENGSAEKSMKPVLQPRREWIKLFKIVQRLVENINDVNLIKQVRNFICKIEMEAGKFRTRRETQKRLESLIGDMIADRVHPQRGKHRLTEEAVTEFRRQLTNISHIKSPKMLTKLMRPQSAGPRLSATKTTDHKQLKPTADTKRRPTSAIVRNSKTLVVKKSFSNVKQRPRSAYPSVHISSRKESKTVNSKIRPQSANETRHKSDSDEKAEQIKKKQSTPAMFIRRVEDNKHKTDSGKTVHRVTLVYNENLKDGNSLPHFTSPPLVNVDKHETKEVETVKKRDTESTEKPIDLLIKRDDKSHNISEEKCENTTVQTEWEETMRTIVNEVLVHQKLQKAVANPLFENKDFIDKFIVYLNQNNVMKQFLRTKSTDRKECFKAPHGNTVQLTFILAFLSRHIEPRMMESTEYLITKCLRYMTCKNFDRPIRERKTGESRNLKHMAASGNKRTQKTSYVADKTSSKKLEKVVAGSGGSTGHKNKTLNQSSGNEKSQKDHSKEKDAKLRPRSLTRDKSLDSSRSQSYDRNQTASNKRGAGTNSNERKESTTRLKTEKRCWKCTQKEAAMNISINWGNKRICDILYESGVPYSEDHLVAAVNAYDLDTLTAILKYLKQTQNWKPSCNEAELAMKLASRYKMLKICKLLKAEGVSGKQSGEDTSRDGPKKKCAPCFIT